MNKMLFSSLTIFAVAFALVLGLGAVNYTNADDLTADYPGQATLFGNDQANNRIGAVDVDRDAAQRPAFDSYGLQGQWLSTY